MSCWLLWGPKIKIFEKEALQKVISIGGTEDFNEGMPLSTMKHSIKFLINMPKIAVNVVVQSSFLFL